MTETKKKYTFKKEIFTKDIYNAAEGEHRAKMRLTINLMCNTMIEPKITFKDVMEMKALEFHEMMNAFDEQHSDMAEAFLG